MERQDGGLLGLECSQEDLVPLHEISRCTVHMWTIYNIVIIYMARWIVRRPEGGFGPFFMFLREIAWAIKSGDASRMRFKAPRRRF